MKHFVFFIAIILNIHDGLAENMENVQAQIAQLRLMSYAVIKEKCYPNSTTNYQRFLEITDNATKCGEIVVKESPIFETPLKSFKDNIQSCVDDWIEEVEHCYSEEMKEWPQLNFDVFLSFIDYVYKNKDELSSPKVRSFVQNCSKEFTDVAQFFRDILPCFKGFLCNCTDIKTGCQELIDIERCVMKQLVEKCPTDEDSIKKLTVDLLASLAEPCAEYDATENPMDNVFTLLAPYAPPNINPDLM